MNHTLSDFFIWWSFVRTNPSLPPTRRWVTARRWAACAQVIAQFLRGREPKDPDLQQWAAEVVLDAGSAIQSPLGLTWPAGQPDGSMRRQARDSGGIAGQLLCTLAQHIVIGDYPPALQLAAWQILYPHTSVLCDPSQAITEWCLTPGPDFLTIPWCEWDGPQTVIQDGAGVFKNITMHADNESVTNWLQHIVDEKHLTSPSAVFNRDGILLLTV